MAYTWRWYGSTCDNNYQCCCLCVVVGVVIAVIGAVIGVIGGSFGVFTAYMKRHPLTKQVEYQKMMWG